MNHPAQPATRPSIRQHPTGLPGLGVLHGRNVIFPRRRAIVHADYAIKLTVSGCGAPYHYRGADNAPCCAGGISLFEPFEPVVAAQSIRSTSFVTLMVDPHLVQQAHESRDRKGRPVFDVTDPVYPTLVHELMVFHRDVLAGFPAIELEERIASVLDLLLGASPAAHRRQPVVPGAVLRSRELILDRLTENFGVEELEQASGYSRFHLMRLFRTHYGLSVHEFRLRARVALAMRLLAKGESQAAVAAEVGFFDQSHFHRHFRRIVGLPPGRFARPQGKRL